MNFQINEKCPIVNTQLNKLTKMFPDLEANILGVIRDEEFIQAADDSGLAMIYTGLRHFNH